MATITGVSVALLDHLLRNDGPVTIESLSCHLAQPPQHVLKQVQSLRDAGCQIASHPQHGLKLVSTGLGCWSDYIEPRHAGRIGRRLVVYQQTTSTQDIARQLACGSDDAHGFVVVADHQTGGRGRLGRRWFAPPGTALLLTAIIHGEHHTTDRLMLATCCAIAQALERVAGLTVQVRWPNDILLEGGKLAGTLIETAGRYTLIGIGLNTAVREHDLPAADSGRRLSATSLLLHDIHVDRLRLLDILLDCLNHVLDHTGDEELHDYWKAHACLLQERVTLEHRGQHITGRVIDLDPRHGLVLADDYGAPHTFPAATTSLVLE